MLECSLIFIIHESRVGFKLDKTCSSLSNLKQNVFSVFCFLCSYSRIHAKPHATQLCYDYYIIHAH